LEVKKLIIIAVVILFLAGCKNSMKEARAAEVRARTKRANEIHALNMAEKRATIPVRLAVKDTLYYSLMVGGVVLIIGTSGALTWLFIGSAVNRVRFHQVPLDQVTRQYPLMIYGNGRRAFNPNTGERLLLAETSQTDRQLTAGSQTIQLAGIIANANNAPSPGEFVKVIEDQISQKQRHNPVAQKQGEINEQ
jgi:hypothetical protein